MRIAVIPGSFDPVTNGHLDIIKRSSMLFDKVIVAVLVNDSKNPLYDIEERMILLKMVTEELSNITIDTFSGLLVDYMNEHKASVIVKGLRAISDFEYELQMAHTNSQLDPKIETMFLMTSISYSYLSSSIVKEVGRLGGSLKGLVPDKIIHMIENKLMNGR